MTLSREAFHSLSAELTGYSTFDLEGTGLVDQYHKLLLDVLGPQLSQELATILENILPHPPGSEQRKNEITGLLKPPSLFWPVMTALITLWYLGTWNQLSDSWYATQGLPIPGGSDAGRTRVPSSAAYAGALAYPAAYAHVPDANPPGFGSWSLPPFEAVN